MDCCNYGQYGAGAAWEGSGYGYGCPAPYAPAPPPYAHPYYAPPPHALDPYPRHLPHHRLRYDYQPPHVHHAEHAAPMEYGAYAAKDGRARRTLARRDQRTHTPAQHLPLPLPPTPPLEIGMNGRGPAYGEQQMWSHYQMGAMNGGWNAAHAPANNGWSRGSCSRDREHMRYPTDCRQMKGLQVPSQNAVCYQDGKSTPYPIYDDMPSNYNRENSARQGNVNEFPAAATHENAKSSRDRACTEPRHSPPAEERPPVVPLPAFQQAFGSTEIGKFAEAFSRTEVAQDDTSSDNFLYDCYSEWGGPTEPQWSTLPTAREIKCEDSY